MQSTVIESLRDLPAIETAATIPAFDYAAQAKAFNALDAARKAVKDARQAAKLVDGKAVLALLYPAIAYGAATFDLQPLALFVKRAKPSQLAKRIIAQAFPGHELMTRGDKTLIFVIKEGFAKVAAQDKIQVLRDAFDSGDALDCDQIKKAFPAPAATAAEKQGKALSAMTKLVKAGLSKSDISQLLKEL